MKIEAIFLHNGLSGDQLLNNLNVFPLAAAKTNTFVPVPEESSYGDIDSPTPSFLKKLYLTKVPAWVMVGTLDNGKQILFYSSYTKPSVNALTTSMVAFYQGKILEGKTPGSANSTDTGTNTDGSGSGNEGNGNNGYIPGLDDASDLLMKLLRGVCGILPAPLNEICRIDGWLFADGAAFCSYKAMEAPKKIGQYGFGAASVLLTYTSVKAFKSNTLINGIGCNIKRIQSQSK